MPILNGSEHPRQEKECVPMPGYSKNGQPHPKFWKLVQYPTVRFQGIPMLFSHLEIGDTVHVGGTQIFLALRKTGSHHRGNSVAFWLNEHLKIKP